MNFRCMLYTLIAVVMFVPVAVRAQVGEPGTCPNDSKLLNGGPTLVYGDEPGTYWNLELNGLEAAGLQTDDDKTAYLSDVFGIMFTSLSEARDYNLDVLSATYDTNQNGYVCVFELRGTRAYLGVPFVNYTFFGVSDDKLRKK